MWVAWVVGGIVSYFITAFVVSSNGNPLHVGAVAFLVTTLAGLIGHAGFRDILESFRLNQWKRDWTFLVATIILGRFAYRVVQVCASFPNLFDVRRFMLPSSLNIAFLVGIVLAFGALGFITKQSSQLVFTFQPKSRGLTLAAVFFIVYFVLAMTLNRQDFNTNNVFFAADTYSWRLRLTQADGYAVGMRAIHPLAFLLLRPAVFLISSLFGTDLFRAAVFLLAFAGSASVFFVWEFLTQMHVDQNHAFLFSALFGMTASQLIFSSLIESYAFSAFLLTLFFALLARRSRFLFLVASALGVLGITVSNLVQAGLGVFAFNGKIQRTLLFGILVVVGGVGLSLINQMIFPNTGLFFNPVEYSTESRFLVNENAIMPSSARTRLVASEMTLFSIVAPQPFVRTYHRVGRADFPKFNFMQGERLSSYLWLGRLAAWIWIGMILASLASLVYSFRVEGFSDPIRLALALLGCLGFLFVFHLFYGFEPFLYAADWTYALVLFVALASRSMLRNSWLQLIMLTLLLLISLNNLSFLYFLMSKLSPFISGPEPSVLIGLASI